MVSISQGQQLPRSPTILQIPDAGKYVMTAASGGTQLLPLSGNPSTCVSLIMRNHSGNSSMFVGSETVPPFSGRGFMLGGGEGITLNITDITQVRVFAAISGQRLSYIWSQQEQGTE